MAQKDEVVYVVFEVDVVSDKWGIVTITHTFEHAHLVALGDEAYRVAMLPLGHVAQKGVCEWPPEWWYGDPREDYTYDPFTGKITRTKS